MEQQIREVVRACSTESHEERAPFPDIVARLAAAGIERYHADLQCSCKTYYLPSGAAEDVGCRPVDGVFAERFSAEGVEAAVRASQRGEIGYRTFCRRIAEAGCIANVVSLAGRRAVYYGRSGATHVEAFPSTP